MNGVRRVWKVCKLFILQIRWDVMHIRGIAYAFSNPNAPV